MADKFNIQGGYFSPQDYMRIDVGGSHDENANGGVQIGVDSQGIPNMLEEDESVYKDYVYSDNIRAGKKYLQQNHIPEKYVGKLYSEIADIFVSEAEDRPLDPISNNGLNAMLARLASAQDEQKQEKEQRDLEAELSKLSPEELSELETMLAEQEVPVEEQEMVAPEAIPEQPMIPAEQPMQSQMMAMGGLLHRFDGGTPGEIVVTDLPSNTGTISQEYDDRTAIRKWIDKTIDDNSTLRSIQRGFRNFSESAPGKVLSLFVPNFNSESGAMGAFVPAIKPASGVSKVMDEANRMLEVEKAYDAAYKAEKVATKTAKSGKSAGEVAKNIGKWAGRVLFPEWSIPAETWKASAKFGTGFWPTAGRVGVTIPAVGAGVGAGAARNYIIGTGIDQIQQRTGNNTAEAYESARATDPFANSKAMGGVINRYDNPYGTGLLDRGTGFGGAVTTNDIMRRHFPTPVLKARPVNLSGLQSQIEALPEVPQLNIPLTGPLYDVPQMGFRPQNTGLVGVSALKLAPVGDNEATMRYKLRNGVPITFAPLNISLKPLPLPTASTGTTSAVASSDPVVAPSTDPVASAQVPVDETKGGGNTTTVTKPAMLPTWPRYAGAIASGLMGVYNAFQRPDKYNIRHYNPELPSARMHLIDPTYNPMDENMIVNDILASSAGTARGLMSAGLGPSTGAALVAADYNAGRNIGDARTRVWDANNQRRNDVIGQRNANAQTLANFDYGMSRDRAQILNMAQLQNIQNDLMRQRLNYAAEGEKYAAIQSNLDSLSRSLAGIGKENFAMNQINNDSAYDYIALPGGGYAYMPKTAKKEETENSRKNGGRLMRPYKKK